MTICASGSCPTDSSTEREVRTLRWTFRRDDETVVCELGLNGDESAYELRVSPSHNPVGTTAEQFGDAMSAFQRHATIERTLVSDGWLLEGFDAERVVQSR